MHITGEVLANLKENYAKLTTTDKRIAAILNDDPEFVAFGTVAEVADRAETSAPSVVRMADKLGYRGFVGMQSAVRSDLSKFLPSSLSRIKQDNVDSSLKHAKAVELHNVEATLSKVDEKSLQKLVRLLADLDRRVYILASDQCSGPALTFADLLSVIRPGVVLLKGSEYRISSQLAGTKKKDLLICMDFERHERWLVKMHSQSIRKGVYAISITNNPLSTIAIPSKINFFASATAPGHFDSNTGLNSLLNLFIDQLAEYSAESVGKNLRRMHKQWESDGVLETTK